MGKERIAMETKTGLRDKVTLYNETIVFFIKSNCI